MLLTSWAASRRASGLAIKEYRTCIQFSKEEPWCMENQQVIREYLDVERKQGVLFGPFERSEVPEVNYSRFGVIPKSNQPGKWRLIVDLSHPEGRSVNDEISGKLCSLQYMRMEEVVRKLLKLGPGAQMAMAPPCMFVHPMIPWDCEEVGYQLQFQLMFIFYKYGLRTDVRLHSLGLGGVDNDSSQLYMSYCWQCTSWNGRNRSLPTPIICQNGLKQRKLKLI